jgi:hypothetical protein
MFAEEQPHLQPLPVEPFLYYQYGLRTMHLDGCVAIDAAYYGARPAGSAATSPSSGMRITSGSWIPARASSCASSAVRSAGGTASPPGDEPWRTPPSVAKLLARASQADPHLRALRPHPPS